MARMVTKEELAFLVLQYLKEEGFSHTEKTFSHEAAAFVERILPMGKRVKGLHAIVNEYMVLRHAEMLRGSFVNGAAEGADEEVRDKVRSTMESLCSLLDDYRSYRSGIHRTNTKRMKTSAAPEKTEDKEYRREMMPPHSLSAKSPSKRKSSHPRKNTTSEGFFDLPHDLQRKRHEIIDKGFNGPVVDEREYLFPLQGSRLSVPTTMYPNEDSGSMDIEQFKSVINTIDKVSNDPITTHKIARVINRNIVDGDMDSRSHHSFLSATEESLDIVSKANSFSQGGGFPPSPPGVPSSKRRLSSEFELERMLDKSPFN